MQFDEAEIKKIYRKKERNEVSSHTALFDRDEGRGVLVCVVVFDYHGHSHSVSPVAVTFINSFHPYLKVTGYIEGKCKKCS